MLDVDDICRVLKRVSILRHIFHEEAQVKPVEESGRRDVSTVIAPAMLLVSMAGLTAMYMFLAYAEVPHMDSGVFMYSGQVILGGGAPYVDAWDHKGPLIYYLNALGLLIANGLTGIMVLEWLLIIAALGLAVTLLLPAANRLWISFLLVAFVASYLQLFGSQYIGNYTETLQIPFNLIAYALLARWLIARSDPQLSAPPLWVVALAIGFAGGVAAMARVSNGTGVFAAALVLMVLAIDRWRTIALYVTAGGLLVVLPMVLVLLSKGALGEGIEQYLSYNFIYLTASEESSQIRSLIRAARLTIVTPLFWLVVLGICCLVLTRTARHKLPAAALLIIGLAELVGVIIAGRPYRHYFLMLLPILLVFGATVWSAVRIEYSFASRRFVVIGLAVLLCVWMGAIMVRDAFRVWPHALQNPTSQTAKIVEYIQANSAPDDPVLIYGLFPGYLALADRRSPTSITYILPMTLAGAPNEPLAKRYTDEVLADPPVLILQANPFCPLEMTECNPADRHSAPEHERLGEFRAWVRENYEKRGNDKMVSHSGIGSDPRRPNSDCRSQNLFPPLRRHSLPDAKRNRFPDRL